MTSPHILFEAWRGRYADNPRALSQYLTRVDGKGRKTWVVEDSDVQVPSDIRTVVRNTPRYFWELARADIYVTNDMSPRYPIHKRGLSYLQTWHGTPAKKIGFDLYPPGQLPTTYARRLARDVARWDYLLSPSAEISSILRTAFRFKGRILETGYPRNDVLISATDADRSRIRTSLGISPGCRVVLYMPTWRDNSLDSRGRPTWPDALSARHLADRLGPNWRVLSRLHPVVATTGSERGHDWVIDVTNHPEVADLYIAADVLVTDYSSAMFDFAATSRPIVLHAPDWAEYRDQTRGFYFPLEEIAPGPIEENWESVARAVESDQEQKYRKEYARFRERFLPLEDGHSSERVIREVSEFGL